MLTLLALGCILGLGTGAALLCTRSMTRSERATIPISVALHALAAVAHVWVVRNVYGTGDMTLYWDQGQALVATLSNDPGLFWGTALRLIIQDGEVRVPVTVYGIGTPTGTVAGIASILAYLLPNSLELACMAVAMTAVCGKLLAYHALRDFVPLQRRRMVLIAILLLPSSVFWSAGLLKEALAFLPLGMAVLGARALLDRSLLRASLLLAFGVVGVALLKPYIVMAFMVSASAWFYADRQHKIHGVIKPRPLPLALTAGLGLGCAAIIGVFFPEYALATLAEGAALQQEIGARVEGGSNYSLASSSGAGVLQQLLMAPAALIAGLYRPFFFEARNATMLLAALETTLILVLALSLLRRRGISRMLTRSAAGPTLIFCLTFSLVMAVSVGLASTNLGTLSRYRMPMMPFLAGALLVLAGARPQRAPKHEASRALSSMGLKGGSHVVLSPSQSSIRTKRRRSGQEDACSESHA